MSSVLAVAASTMDTYVQQTLRAFATRLEQSPDADYVASQINCLDGLRQSAQEVGISFPYLRVGEKKRSELVDKVRQLAQTAPAQVIGEVRTFLRGYGYRLP